MLNPIRILIVEDDPKVRSALRMRLRLEAGIAIVGEAGDGPTAIELSVSLKPDVVVLDLHLPGLDGLSVCRLLETQGSTVVVLSMDDADTVRERCLAAGAAAFVSKQDSMHILLSAIRSALSLRPLLTLGCRGP